MISGLYGLESNSHIHYDFFLSDSLTRSQRSDSFLFHDLIELSDPFGNLEPAARIPQTQHSDPVHFTILLRLLRVVKVILIKYLQKQVPITST